jgi:hypothetical protein
LILEAFQHDHDDEDEDANHISIKISLQVEDVPISNALPHPLAVMTEALTAQPTRITVHDRVVHYRPAN